MSTKSKLIFIFILFLGIAIGEYKYSFMNKELPYDFAVVEKRNITQKVSATGQVVPARKLGLQFEVQGRIEDVKVETGDKVEAGNVLAVLDTNELNIRILEARAARDIATANLEKVLSGASTEEIKVYETAVENANISFENAKVSLNNAEQNLTDVKVDAENDLYQAYEDTLNELDDSYLKLYNAFTVTDLIQRIYFYSTDQQSIRVKENNKYKIEKRMIRAEFYLDIAKNDPENKNIDTALSEMKDSLNSAFQALAVIRGVCEEPTYRNIVSATDKTSLDTQKSYVNTALSNITDSEQAISSAKLISESSTNTAQFSLDTAQNTVNVADGNLKSAQDKLAQIKASPRQIDIDLVQAQLNQAEAVLARAKQQLTKAILVAPCRGVITDIKREEGEVAGTMTADPAISLLCLGQFQIEVDISETDIGKVSLRDSAEISLDAFQEKAFSGKVIKIDPAETVIQGVIYYKITIAFDELDEKIKSGMTANIDIIVETRENVLALPQRAVLTKNEKKIVRILENKKIKEIEVKTGIPGSEGEMEILSGLKEGDKVITFIKKD